MGCYIGFFLFLYEASLLVCYCTWSYTYLYLVGVKYYFSVCVYRGSYMSVHVLLHLSNELGKRDKCKACQALYLFSPTSLINSLIQEHECKFIFII